MQIIHNDSTWIDVSMYDIFVVEITRSANYVTGNVVVQCQENANLSNDVTFKSLPNGKNKNSRYSIIIGTGLSQTYKLQQRSYILFGLVGMPPLQKFLLLLQEWLGVTFF